jgi:hypothetical protein
MPPRWTWWRSAPAFARSLEGSVSLRSVRQNLEGVGGAEGGGQGADKGKDDQKKEAKKKSEGRDEGERKKSDTPGPRN